MRAFRVYSIDQFVLCHSTFEYKAVLNARLFLLRCLISVPMTRETILNLVCLYPKDRKCLIRKDQHFLKLIRKKVGAIFWALTKVLPHCERWTEPPSVKQVAGYNRKIWLRFLHSNFFLIKRLRKKKVFPFQKRKVCNQGSNPRSSTLVVPSPLHYHANTTETGRNLIIQIQFSVFLL